MTSPMTTPIANEASVSSIVTIRPSRSAFEVSASRKIWGEKFIARSVVRRDWPGKGIERPGPPCGGPGPRVAVARATSSRASLLHHDVQGRLVDLVLARD